MAAKTLSVYIAGDTLFDEVKAAHEDESNPFDYKKICTEALDRALHPEKYQTISMDEVERLAAVLPVDDNNDFEYEVKYLDPSLVDAYLENARLNSGRCGSVSAAGNGQLILLMTWPRTTP